MKHDLESVRGELKQLGYLDPGLERYFLQDALRGGAPLSSLVRLAARDAILAGPILALLTAFSIAVVNGNLERTPFDVLPLALHLLIPGVVVGFLLFVVLGALLVPLARWAPRQVEVWSLALTGLGVGLPLCWIAIAARHELAAAGQGFVTLEALVGAGLVYALGKVLATGLFAWGIQLTERPPRRRWLGRRVWAALAVATAFFAWLPLLWAASPDAVESAPALPTRPGDAVALIGIDGISAAELDYELRTAVGHGDLPALRALLDGGAARIDRYARGAEAPASFWTTIATGWPTPRHGVAALDAMRPRGVRTPLALVGPLRTSLGWLWTRTAVPLGWVEHRATLADRREAHTIWELAARGGDPVLAVNWWATYPAEELPGLIVGHGAYGLLAANSPGAAAGAGRAVAPAARRAEVDALRDPTAAAAFANALRAALPEAAADALLEHSFLPDALAWRVVERLTPEGARALAIYLPGLDIAATADLEGRPVLQDLVREQLRELDEHLAALQARFQTIVVVFDPGRRALTERTGAVLIHRAGCSARGSARSGLETREPLEATEVHEVTEAPEGVAPSLLRALGLPQSTELAEPIAGCDWPEPPARLPTLGRRGMRDANQDASGEEYLKNLRSLGYL